MQAGLRTKYRQWEHRNGSGRQCKGEVQRLVWVPNRMERGMHRGVNVKAGRSLGCFQPFMLPPGRQ